MAEVRGAAPGAPGVLSSKWAEMTPAERVRYEAHLRRSAILQGVTPENVDWAHRGLYKEFGIDLASLGRRADGKAGFEDVAPDAADIAVRDIVTGRVSRARRGSMQSAFGDFSAASPLGADSILGRY